MTAPLLDVRELSVAIRTPAATLQVLDRVSLDVARGETVALVGESGAGKSVLANALLGVLAPSARVTGGGASLSGAALPGALGLALAMQDPARALNPVRPIGRQIADVLRAHGEPRRRTMTEALLHAVGLSNRAAHAYPHALSGGMTQRAMLALALATNPTLLIADEPTTGLDDEAEAQVLDLLALLGQQRGMATLLVTHDLTLAGARAARIAVLHAGQLVEQGEAARLLARPAHPYTQALLRASPRPGATLVDLAPIPGRAPDLARPDLPACRFVDRCPRAIARCRDARPPLHVDGTHRVACHAPA
jgi:peptide/nickel transport system ATP-binding protein